MQQECPGFKVIVLNIVLLYSKWWASASVASGNVTAIFQFAVWHQSESTYIQTLTGYRDPHCVVLWINCSLQPYISWPADIEWIKNHKGLVFTYLRTSPCIGEVLQPTVYIQYINCAGSCEFLTDKRVILDSNRKSDYEWHYILLLYDVPFIFHFFHVYQGRFPFQTCHFHSQTTTVWHRNVDFRDQHTEKTA